MTTLLLAIGFLGLFILLMSVRLLFVKNGQFKGTCASQSPFLQKEGATCGMCGKTLDGDESCQKDDDDDNEVNKVLNKY